MNILYILTLAMRVHCAGLSASTDYECEMAEQAQSQLLEGDLAAANDTLQLLAECRLDEKELQP